MHRLVKKYLRLLIPTVVILILAPFVTQKPRENPWGRYHNCMLLSVGADSSSMNYPVGYNYEMLSRFFGDHRLRFRISIPDDLLPVDTLFARGVSLIALPGEIADTLSGAYLLSPVLADGSVWVMKEENRKLAKDAARWLNAFMDSPAHDTVVMRFTPHYNPAARAASGRKYPFASPYDDLLKKYSEEIGWDWHALAALVWQESKFRIEARSKRGASGLMQMTEHTARSNGVTDPLDPEENLGAGVSYIRSLEKIFGGRASGEDLTELTLAAYNAGQGRILDCIHYAEAHGLPSSTWQDLRAVLPMMRDTSIAENDSSVRLGTFKGYQTERYVECIDSLTRKFRSIAP